MHMMQKARPGTEYFTTTENATKILRTSRSRIYKFIKSGKIQAKKRKQGIVTFWEINKFSLIKYL